MSKLTKIARKFHEQLPLSDAIGILTDYRQLLSLTEEVGEFAGAIRRYEGWAREDGDWASIEDEAADVAISLAVMCEQLGVDLDAAIERKGKAVLARLKAGERD